MYQTFEGPEMFVVTPTWAHPSNEEYARAMAMVEPWLAELFARRGWNQPWRPVRETVEIGGLPRRVCVQFNRPAIEWWVDRRPYITPTHQLLPLADGGWVHWTRHVDNKSVVSVIRNWELIAVSSWNVEYGSDPESFREAADALGRV